MRDDSVIATGTAFAATVFLGYAACTVLFWAFPDAAAGFMNALFHGLDFRTLQADRGFTFGAFALAAIVLTGWAFALGCLFAWLHRLLAAPDGGIVVSTTLRAR